MRSVSVDVGRFVSFPVRETKANDQTQRMAPALRRDRLLQQNPSDSDRTDALQRTVAKCQDRTSGSRPFRNTRIDILQCPAPLSRRYPTAERRSRSSRNITWWKPRRDYQSGIIFFWRQDRHSSRDGTFRSVCKIVSQVGNESSASKAPEPCGTFGREKTLKRRSR
jgi:hypothetical protein